MPFTFFAHQAPVLPLKLSRPAWFSGLALVLGSMAPDLEYFLRGEPIAELSHTLLGQFAFCLPVSLLLLLVIERLVAPNLPHDLPDLGPFHLRDYAALANARRDLVGWLKVAASALLGSFSHIAWDGFTHGHGWAVERLPALSRPAAPLRGPRGARALAFVALGALFGAGITLATGARGDLLREAVCVFLRATTFGFAGLCVVCLRLDSVRCFRGSASSSWHDQHRSESPPQIR